MVVGTPGIGKTHSTDYLHLKAPLGEITFLLYYLSCQIGRKKVTMLSSRDSLYHLTEKNIITTSPTYLILITMGTWMLPTSLTRTVKTLRCKNWYMSSARSSRRPHRGTQYILDGYTIRSVFLNLFVAFLTKQKSRYRPYFILSYSIRAINCA